MQAGLYIVGTPIGNLSDMSSRAVQTLRDADLILCEDTRVSGKLCANFDIKTKLSAFHEHNEGQSIPDIIDKIDGGMAVALISDSGMPLVSDPGFKLVREARARKILISVVPGASALVSALVLSGFPTDRFSFLGFLPAKDMARDKELSIAARIPITIIYYESPNRIMDTIAALAKIMPERKIAVARELTKIYEEVVVGYPADFPEFECRGEMVLLIEPAPRAALSDEAIKEIVEDVAKRNIKTKDAAEEISARSGISKKDAYDLALGAKK
ncbi:MAG: 16S rRNA (cytidine(1402)-2'-O)-methyltransferase [Rickettsiales bacterium]|jgi:16S rRNA (cytidine1402-2'-O)-methyltransferase|nr:16S rRNA (cytidine(1402)-2'-O)-methyltransferase [Rickettsiales bacterium]